MKKKILFVGNGSFKNLSDTYWRIEYLKNDYEITYLGFKEGLISDSVGFRLVELDGFGNSILSKIRLFLNYYRLTKTSNFDLIVINYFVGVFLFSFVAGRKFVDIRSSIIKYYFVSRFFFNLFLKFESSFFINKILYYWIWFF